MAQDSNYKGTDGIYPKRTEDEHALILGRFLNDGRHLVSKRITTKTLFKFLKGVAKSFKSIEEKANELINGRLLTESTTNLDEWERVVGVPDECYDGLGTIENRQRYTLAKLSADGVSTAEQLEWICSVLGFSVTIIPGHFFWDNPDPRVSLSTEKESRFTIVFEIDFLQSIASPDTFSYTFPFIFGENPERIMKCFMRKIIDSNVNAQFISKASFNWQNTVDTGPEYQNTVDTGEYYQNV